MIAKCICVCTSYPAHVEPRAVKHATALARAYPQSRIVFVDSSPTSEDVHGVPPALAELPNVSYAPFRYATRRSAVARFLVNKLLYLGARLAVRMRITLPTAVLGAHVAELAAFLAKIDAQVFVAHNIDCLLPAYAVARRCSAMLVFDSMEFHSDMGGGQSKRERDTIRRIEAEVLPKCALVLTSAPTLADALSETYKITTPTSLYNTAPVQQIATTTSHRTRLYWRNGTIGISERGLGDVLDALALLPSTVELHLQGREPSRGLGNLFGEIERRGLRDRIKVHPPFAPHEAVQEAAKYDIGLCLERDTSSNHRLTVSNKLFDYMMAGLAIICSDLPGLHQAAAPAGALMYRPGDVKDLAAKIDMLHRERAQLCERKKIARRYAMEHANAEMTEKKFLAAFDDAVASKTGTCNSATSTDADRSRAPRG